MHAEYAHYPCRRKMKSRGIKSPSFISLLFTTLKNQQIIITKSSKTTIRINVVFLNIKMPKLIS